jgi:hypothetical protein
MGNVIKAVKAQQKAQNENQKGEGGNNTIKYVCVCVDACVDVCMYLIQCEKGFSLFLKTEVFMWKRLYW